MLNSALIEFLGRNLLIARSAQEIWEAALGELQLQVTKSNYKTWLEKTKGLSYQNNHFVVDVPNTFVAEYLDKNQRSLIEKTLTTLTHYDTKVLFQINSQHEPSLANNVHQDIPHATQARPSGLNLKYTFDSFIIGQCNRLAHAAALGIAENPGHTYNPLFIYGGAGLGKTHLLHAIGHKALASNIQVLYVSTEQFTNEFINAIRDRKTEAFRNKYRSVDMLLIDDIHFISGKEQTEESLFHTFNELHNTNRQIVITSDCLPKSLPQLRERFRSRLEWGLVVDIQPPDFETRLAILRAKAAREKANIASDVLEFIAQRIQQNIRELEGLLNRVVAYTKLIGATATPELAAYAIEDIASKKSRMAPLTPNLIIETVASSFQLTPTDLKSRRRDKQTTLARQVAMYIIRQETNYPLAQIGRELGERDHSTVIHAYQKIASDIEASSYLRGKISAIQQIIHP